jgi:hypothetical protein
MQRYAYTWIQPVWIPRTVKFWTFFSGTFFNFLALDFLLFVGAMQSSVKIFVPLGPELGARSGLFHANREPKYNHGRATSDRI